MIDIDSAGFGAQYEPGTAPIEQISDNEMALFLQDFKDRRALTSDEYSYFYSKSMNAKENLPVRVALANMLVADLKNIYSDNYKKHKDEKLELLAGKYKFLKEDEKRIAKSEMKAFYNVLKSTPPLYSVELKDLYNQKQKYTKEIWAKAHNDERAKLLEKATTEKILRKKNEREKRRKKENEKLMRKYLSEFMRKNIRRYLSAIFSKHSIGINLTSYQSDLEFQARMLIIDKVTNNFVKPSQGILAYKKSLDLIKTYPKKENFIKIIENIMYYNEHPISGWINDSI